MRARWLPNVPHPLGWTPILGNTTTIRANFHRWPEFINEVSQAMGYQAWALSMLNAPEIVFMPCDEAVVKHVLKDNFENYSKPKRNKEALFPLLGRGIFNVDGKLWEHQRKTSLHMFTRRQMRDHMTRVLAGKAKVFREHLAAAAAEGKTIDIQGAYFAYTLDSFVEIAFGVEMDSITQAAPFGAAFDKVQSALNQRFYDPLWRIKSRLNLGTEADVTTYLPAIHSFTSSIISRRVAEMRAERDRGESCQRADLLSLYIDAALRAGEDVTEDELYDVTINFILAGRDTTACALAWTTWEVANHPEVLAALRAEADAAAPRADGGLLAHGSSPEALYETVQGMDYAQAVVSEVLRLHPSVPVDSKQSLGPDVWPDGTVIPHAGVTVGYSPYVFGRSTLLWGADADRFSPGRWADEGKISYYKFLTFNAGKRLCLGLNLASTT
ncbi:cytochrome P450 CYP704B12v2 [Thecamonas trahens ATCC 50062]|uniref:Cytochrome P450 CYP704B12v2 n=1 Tax=Thecamonas trahens ATCC 50062 TaxID=461836 RepID=A0A0L0DUF9_THETB|nr:cytochrome P450 CYP704B12v2 [Thecamonas trahens ATCC 50062]KNC55910.1 cytochrome P450 CYP704B12v2 [Thecamonas trahens ATCC 50062]|eukprot:XP_013752729.1 cytochrome P450 CYP704B12v2 [Thecamonas trahens ATCC 50062]